MVDLCRPLVVLLLALALSATTGWAIRCYVCSSEDDPSCKDDFPTSHHHHKLSYCTRETMNSIRSQIPGLFTDFDYRSVQPEDFQCVKSKRRENGRLIVVRSCTVPRADTFDVCSQLKARGDLEFCENCHTEACNGALSLSQGPLLALLLAAPALATLRVHSY